MKNNGMANRANQGIHDDVSYEVVFGESITASYVMICSSCLCGTTTHGAHDNSFKQKTARATMICTPNTGHPVLGVFLCDTVMNTRRCASNYIDKENGSRHQKE